MKLSEALRNKVTFLRNPSLPENQCVEVKYDVPGISGLEAYKFYICHIRKRRKGKSYKVQRAILSEEDYRIDNWAVVKIHGYMKTKEEKSTNEN